MLEGLVGGLIVAWILTFFKFDVISMDALKELFNISISRSTYYFIFAMIGLIAGSIKKNK